MCTSSQEDKHFTLFSLCFADTSPDPSIAISTALMRVERGAKMPPRVHMDYKPQFYVPQEGRTAGALKPIRTLKLFKFKSKRFLECRPMQNWPTQTSNYLPIYLSSTSSGQTFTLHNF